MEGFLIFCLSAAVLILIIKISNLKKRVHEIEERLVLIDRESGLPEAVIDREQVAVPKTRLETVKGRDGRTADSTIKESADKHLDVAAIKQESSITIGQKARKDETVQPPAEVSAWKQNANSLWFRVEKQFAENWTGIIGAIVMVMGVGFLGVYAAIKMGPLLRFALITAFAAFLFVLHLLLKNKEVWHGLSHWLRSGSGAIVLFACIGAGGIPGLKWIEDPLIALFLLVFGIGVNLYFGFAGKTQLFASLHVLMSLAALGVAPQNNETMIIAAVVVLFGVILSYRDRWEYHLAVTITGFLVFHVFWYSELGFFEIETVPDDARLMGLAITGIIGIAAAFIHYRELYRTEKFEAKPFIAHLLNWCYMATGFLMYTTGSKWNTLILAAASLCGFVLARRARSMGIGWLYRTDTLIAQAVALMALSTLGRWGIDGLYIWGILYIQVLLFYMMMVREGEGFLSRIGTFLHHASAIAVMVVAADSAEFSVPASLAESSLVLAGALVTGLAAHVFFVRQRGELPDSIDRYLKKEPDTGFSIGGVILPLMLAMMLYILHAYPWAPWAAAGAGICLLLLRQMIQSRGLGVGMIAAAVFLHLLCWTHIGENVDMTVWGKAMYSLPFFLLSLGGMKLSFVNKSQKNLTWIGIYLFSAHLALSAYYVLNGVSPFIPGLVWILVSPLFLEVALFSSRRVQITGDGQGGSSIHLLNAGAMFLGIFLVRHVLVHMQSELYLGPVKIRFALELLGLAVILYWALAGKQELMKSMTGWARSHPLFWELLILFGAFTIALEVPVMWHPPVWAVAAAAILFIGTKWRERLSRFRFYSLFFYWVAAFHIAFISSSQASPSVYWLDREWTGGLAGLMLLFGFIIFLHNSIKLEEVEFPFEAARMKKILNAVRARMNLWVYYPFFISIALFLYWSFDSSILTLLWVVQAFAVFVLGAILRESHFRYLSMGALIICLLRLVFFDLARSATLTRAVVFLGVGAIMLVMNYLYGKYRERF